MRVYNKPVIIPANTIMNTTINSQALELLIMYGYSIQVVFTGTPTGTFKLQASSDPVNGVSSGLNTPVNWTDVANSSQSITAAGNYMWNVFDVMYNWVRLVYQDTSGGTSTAIITVSQFNGKGI